MALWLALGVTHGQTSPCPVDGVRLPLPPARSWNDAGGLDSDGCRWSLDADGAWRVAGLESVIACPQCHAAFRFDHLPLPLTQDESDRVRAALRGLPEANPADPTQRWRLAAVTYEALGPARLQALRLSPDAFLGELLLHGAWAARASAVLPAFDPTYRPRDLPRAWLALSQLEEGMQRQRRRDRGLGPLLLEAERLRRLTDQVASLPGPVAQAIGDRLTEGLIQLEQALYDLRGELPPEHKAGSGADDHLALIRACLRYGDPERRAAWERSARARFGEVVDDQLGAIEAASAREAELLGLAEARFAAAASAPDLTPPRRARLRFLAGDCARRRGADAEARDHLQQARQLAPGSRASQDAAFLLGKD